MIFIHLISSDVMAIYIQWRAIDLIQKKNHHSIRASGNGQLEDINLSDIVKKPEETKQEVSMSLFKETFSGLNDDKFLNDDKMWDDKFFQQCLSLVIFCVSLVPMAEKTQFLNWVFKLSPHKILFKSISKPNFHSKEISLQSFF